MENRSLEEPHWSLLTKKFQCMLMVENIKGADVLSSSTCRVCFSEKYELSITILCNISMVVKEKKFIEKND